MIRIDSKGTYRDTIRYLKRIENNIDTPSVLDKYGRIGVERLSKATPINTGLTSDSWRYDITETSAGYSINFYNDNVQDGYHVVLIIQNGHITPQGTWIEANDFITPIIDELCKELSLEI